MHTQNTQQIQTLLMWGCRSWLMCVEGVTERDIPPLLNSLRLYLGWDGRDPENPGMEDRGSPFR